jgi:hypothetical protein
MTFDFKAAELHTDNGIGQLSNLLLLVKNNPEARAALKPAGTLAGAPLLKFPDDCANYMLLVQDKFFFTADPQINSENRKYLAKNGIDVRMQGEHAFFFLGDAYV